MVQHRRHRRLCMHYQYHLVEKVIYPQYANLPADRMLSPMYVRVRPFTRAR